MQPFGILLDIVMFLTSITFIGTLVGFIYLFMKFIKEKNLKLLFLHLLFPPYVIPTILKMPENNEKKILSILILGSFVLSLFLGVIRIIITPPV